MIEKKQTLQVALRCRPMSQQENIDKRKQIISIDQNKGEIIVVNPQAKEGDEPKEFKFDHIFDSNYNQSLIYDKIGYPIVESILQGQNGTILTYGQTGSGKTYTLEGEINDYEKRGIIPRTFDQIFKSIKENPNIQFTVRVSMFEIYNEEIRDLLEQGSKKLEIRETSGNVYVKDLQNFTVKSPEELMEKLKFGQENRKIIANILNKDLSRTHSIFTITIEACVEVDGIQKITKGKLNLVKLPGSERHQKVHVQEQQKLKEAISISNSLCTLGNVFTALQNGKSSHIPFRDSKLTRILQDSLGENTKISIFANIGPADFNYNEIIQTIRFVQRFKSNKCNPQI